MKTILAIGTLFATAISGAVAQACAAGTAQEINGNWYCQAVQAISYTNFGTPGTYDKVTSFNSDGKCSSTGQDYAGGISPLDEEISWHFRGPVSLKQFAYYVPGSGSSNKRNPRRSPSERRHGHKHVHKHDKKTRAVEEKHIVVEKRAPCEMVTATMPGSGQVVSWMNDYMCSGSTAAPSVSTEVSVMDDSSATTFGATATSAPTGATTMDAAVGSWGRQAYYNAADGTADGLVFLNHNGGQGSGVFDYTWGNSLSYSSSDGTSGSASPQLLAEGMLDDNIEVVIMSDDICQNDDCGTVRPGTVAYHGFGGGDKVFMMEFSMPLTGKTGWVEDMPAIWTLNAQIPNTLQYGEATCSCWESGCGEWDIFEILDSGNTRAKSTFHGNPSGGDSNYFTRPTNSTMKAAVIFQGGASAGHIVVLPDDSMFNTTIADGVVAAYLETASSQAQGATFDLTS